MHGSRDSEILPGGSIAEEYHLVCNAVHRLEVVHIYRPVGCQGSEIIYLKGSASGIVIGDIQDIGADGDDLRTIGPVGY